MWESRVSGGAGESGALPEAPGELGEVGTFLSPPAAGVHRQILLATLGWFVGYQLVKRAEYMHAKVDRELFEYVRHHPVDFHAATGTLSRYFGRLQPAVICQ